MTFSTDTDSRSDSEMRLLRLVSLVDSECVEVVRSVLDQFRGAEEFVDDDDEPVSEITQVLQSIHDSDFRLRRRILCRKLGSIRCWQYQAMNEKREIWSPWVETLRGFQARSERIEYWKVDSDCMPSGYWDHVREWVAKLYENL